jgi:cytochrome c peroxidase
MDFPRWRPSLSLAQRCLSPLENPLEMGSSIQTRAAAYGKLEGMAHLFNRLSDPPDELGVTSQRIGAALASYLQSLKPPVSPYHRHSTGDDTALNDAEMRGLEIFLGRGKCGSCHSGPDLRDGRVHASLRSNHSVRSRSDRLLEIRMAQEGLSPQKFGRQGPPDRRGLSVGLEQVVRDVVLERSSYLGSKETPLTFATTPTLWDVARTAPYFRDGSAKTLEEAVTQHMAELRDRGPASEPEALLPSQLRPEQMESEKRYPRRLSPREFADLIDFLEAL